MAKAARHSSRGNWNGLLSDVTKFAATQHVRKKNSLLKSFCPANSFILSKFNDSLNFTLFTALGS